MRRLGLGLLVAREALLVVCGESNLLAVVTTREPYDTDGAMYYSTTTTVVRGEGTHVRTISRRRHCQPGDANDCR